MDFHDTFNLTFNSTHCVCAVCNCEKIYLHVKLIFQTLSRFFFVQVWRDWALSRNRKPETKLERFSEAPVDIRVADIEVMSYWLPRFIKEVKMFLKVCVKFVKTSCYNVFCNRTKVLLKTQTKSKEKGWGT